jgi:YfiR/HmsC-like
MRPPNSARGLCGIPWRVHRFVQVVVAIALLAIAEGTVDGQQIRPTEAQVKAAFLFNFGKYVTWPRVTGDTFSICVLGQDPFGEALDSIVSGETLNGKPADVRRIRGAQEASTCQIVFISSSQETHLQSTLVELAKYPALTVSDIPDFVQHGGMIQFVDEDDRVRFTVNLAAAQKAGFVVSSELLKVAKYVQRVSGPGGVQ